jgi:histidinol dehydrogenase
MKPKEFGWDGATETAEQIRIWTVDTTPGVSEAEIRDLLPAIAPYEDADLLALTARFDATERKPESLRLRVEPEALEAALGGLKPQLRESLELAIANVRAVSTAQVEAEPTEVTLPQGQVVRLRDVPVGAAGIYAPGGRAAYPSSVFMGVVPARIAGVERVALATPPGPDGEISPVVLATAALCEVDEVYALGGAQAIFALARGSDSIDRVDVVAGPGNAWVRQAKRLVSGEVGVDSFAGPSELMLVAGDGTDPEWAALDLCAQAEHGADGPLVVAAVEEEVLKQIADATKRAAAERPGVGDAPLALVQVPDLSDAIDLANAFAPEHLELFEEDAALLADRVTTAGCVFAGRYGATAFGDYVAGSNHVLPTGGAGRFSGPLGPAVFRRKIATVEVSAGAAAKLAPHVDAIARAEGFPIHGESAMIRR